MYTTTPSSLHFFTQETENETFRIQQSCGTPQASRVKCINIIVDDEETAQHL